MREREKWNFKLYESTKNICRCTKDICREDEHKKAKSSKNVQLPSVCVWTKVAKHATYTHSHCTQKHQHIHAHHAYQMIWTHTQKHEEKKIREGDQKEANKEAFHWSVWSKHINKLSKNTTKREVSAENRKKHRNRSILFHFSIY